MGCLEMSSSTQDIHMAYANAAAFVGAHVCKCRCIACTWARGQPCMSFFWSWVPLFLFIYFFWDTFSLAWNSASMLGWLADEPQWFLGWGYLAPPSRCTCHRDPVVWCFVLFFKHEFWASNSDLDALKASTLLTAVFPALALLFHTRGLNIYRSEDPCGPGIRFSQALRNN